METALKISAYELERGKPMPSKNHAIVQGNLNFVLRQDYGNTYSILPEISISGKSKDRTPDLGIFTPLTFSPKQDEIKLSQIPLGVIEILSPTQNLTELVDKSQEYFDLGIKSYWLVIPSLKTIHVFDLEANHTVFAEKENLVDTQLNIELNLEDIFK